MPQPVSNTLTVVSGSLLANKISYVVDGQNRNYRGGYGGLSWMSEAEATNNVIFIGNTSTIGRGPADKPLFYPSFNTSDANIIYAANTLPGSPRNFTTVAGAYDWATNNNFFINSANNPIPRVNGDSLALYIDADQPTSYPQTGTSWFDLSGIGNNSALYNGPTWNSRGYIDFDGTDDFVGIGNTGVTKLNQNYQTLRFLTYITSVGPNGYAELYAVFNANRTGIKWQDNGIGMDANGDFYNVFVDVSNAYSRWMDITCVIDRVSNIFKVYKNGTYIGQDTFTGYTANSTSITVGANNLTGNGGDYIKGSISEISVYGKELSLAEIKQNYFQSNIVTNGLVFTADANNLVSYPRSGTTLYNLTGSQTGNLVNGVGYSSNNGGYWTFDGIDDYIQINFTNLGFDVPWTIGCWFNTSVTQSTSVGLFNLSYFPELMMRPDGKVFVWNSIGPSAGVVTGYPAVESTNSYNDGQWHYIVGSYATGGLVKLYVDGTLINSASYAPDGVRAIYDNIYMGIEFNNGPKVFNGKISSGFVHNRELSATEVQQNYEATKYKFQGQQMVTQGLVMYLDAANKDSYSGTGNTWYDLSGNNNNATKNGNSANPIWNSSGGYFAFAASDGSVGANNIFTVANSATLQNLTDITVQFICAMETKTPVGSDYDWMCIVTKGEEGGNQRPGTSVNQLPGNRYYHIETPTGVNSVGDLFTNADYTGNKWNLFQTRVSNAGGTQGWLNGTQVSTAGATTTGNTSPLYIGSNGFFELFKGKMGVICIYNRALSDAELVQNYNFFKTRFGL